MKVQNNLDSAFRKRTGFYFYHYWHSDLHKFCITKDMFRSMDVYWRNKVIYSEPTCHLPFKGYIL